MQFLYNDAFDRAMRHASSLVDCATYHPAEWHASWYAAPSDGGMKRVGTLAQCEREERDHMKIDIAQAYTLRDENDCVVVTILPVFCPISAGHIGYEVNRV